MVVLAFLHQLLVHLFITLAVVVEVAIPVLEVLVVMEEAVLVVPQLTAQVQRVLLIQAVEVARVLVDQLRGVMALVAVLE
jgi:hypothetical protein